MTPSLGRVEETVGEGEDEEEVGEEEVGEEEVGEEEAEEEAAEIRLRGTSSEPTAYALTSGGRSTFAVTTVASFTQAFSVRRHPRETIVF